MSAKEIEWKSSNFEDEEMIENLLQLAQILPCFAAEPLNNAQKVCTLAIPRQTSLQNFYLYILAFS